MKVLKFSAFVAVLFFASATMAQPPRGGGMGGAGQWWRAPQVIEKIKLTEDQQNKIDALNEAYLKERTDLRSKLETQSKDLEDLFAGADVDEKQMKKALQEFAATQSQMFNSQIMVKYNTRKVLSKEQIQIALKEYPDILQLRPSRGRPDRAGPRGGRPQMERGPGPRQERKAQTGAPAAPATKTPPKTPAAPTSPAAPATGQQK